MRTFDTGATRDTDDGKPDYEGFFSPLVIARYGQYMHEYRVQSDGALRTSDNWQKGIPKDEYIKSALRHVLDWWLEHDGYPSRDGLQEALCGVMFNVMGYLHEDLKEHQDTTITREDFNQMLNTSVERYLVSNPGLATHWMLHPTERSGNG